MHLMTNQTPTPQPPRDERQDELIACIIAFGAIGTVLFLGLGRLGTQPLFSTAQRLAGSTSSRSANATDVEEELFDFLLADDEPDDSQEIVQERLSAAERRRLAERADRPGAAPFIVVPSANDPIVAELDEDVIALDEDAAREDLTDAVDPTPEADSGVAVVPEPETNLAEEDAPAEPADTEDISGIEVLADVDSDYWAAPFIDRLAEEGIVTGFMDSTFRPDEPVTRAQFAAQLSQAFGTPDDPAGTNYSDITGDYWASGAIGQVSAADFMSGYPEGDFRPNEQVSRLEVLIALASGLSLEQPSAVDELLAQYRDQNRIPDWAAPKIAAATDESLVVNHPEPDSLNPDQAATRAETAAMIYQALVQQGRLEPVSSEYIVRPE